MYINKKQFVPIAGTGSSLRGLGDFTGIDIIPDRVLNFCEIL